jgi:pimeloyl-ACP methyl ester carboxylesterase
VENIYQQTGLLAINQAQLYYELVGTKTAPTLTFIHPGNTDCRIWQQQFSCLMKKYRVMRYDLRGHGRTMSSPGEYFYHEDLVHLLQGLNIEQTSLVGLGAGASIAIDFALTYPEHVISLILVSPPLRGSGHMVYSDEETAFLSQLKKTDIKQLVDFMLGKWVVGDKRTQHVINSSVYNFMIEIYKDAFLYQSLSSTLLPFPKIVVPLAINKLEEVKVPVLVITGAYDMDAILNNANIIMRGISQARKYQFLEAGHCVNLEVPDKFNLLINDFVDKHYTG